MGFWDELFSRKRQKCQGVRLTYPRHYEDMLRKTGEQKRRLDLLNIDYSGPYIVLTYKWNEDLSREEADNLDTRVRAFIACAIYDAAKEAGLSCVQGPLWGIRPTWNIEDEGISYTLVNGGFDVSEKTCFGSIGSALMNLKCSPEKKIFTEQLGKSFRSCFSFIIV